VANAIFEKSYTGKMAMFTGFFWHVPQKNRNSLGRCQQNTFERQMPYEVCLVRNRVSFFLSSLSFCFFLDSFSCFVSGGKSGVFSEKSGHAAMLPVKSDSTIKIAENIVSIINPLFGCHYCNLLRSTLYLICLCGVIHLMGS